MCPHQNTPNEPDHSSSPHDADQEGVVVPMRRRPRKENTDNVQKTDHVQGVCWYDQTQRQGGSRRFSGHVNRVGGAEGERLRGELASVIRDLLVWAAERSHTAEQPSGIKSTEDGEAA